MRGFKAKAKGAESAPLRTVAYLRVANDERADEVVSLGEQRDKVEAYASLFKLDLVSVEVDDGVSIDSLTRPALGRALAMLRQGSADALLVARLDRLSRRVRDVSDLVQRYCSDGKRAFLSVAEQIDTRTSHGRVVMNMIATFREWEVDNIRELAARTTPVKHDAEFVPPFGYALSDDGMHVVADAVEQEVLEIARRMRAAGLSLRQVAEELHKAGIRARRNARVPAGSAGQA